MIVLVRLYSFHRRCGMARGQSFHRALATVLRDLNLTRRT